MMYRAQRMRERIWRRVGRRVQGESGMGLAELLVYIVITAALATMITILVVRVFAVNREVTTVSQANNDAQVFMDRMELIIRNAADVRVPPQNVAGQQALVAVVRSTNEADNADSYRCVGFVYRQIDDSLWQYSADEAASPQGVLTSIISGGSSWNSSHWDSVLVGVEPRAGEPVFDFNSGTVEVNFAISPAPGELPVEMHSTVSPLSPGGVEDHDCFNGK